MLAGWKLSIVIRLIYIPPRMPQPSMSTASTLKTFDWVTSSARTEAKNSPINVVGKKSRLARSTTTPGEQAMTVQPDQIIGVDHDSLEPQRSFVKSRANAMSVQP